VKRWRCNACLKRGLPAEECEWDDHLTQSHCRACGEPAVRIMEFGCFQCHDEGVIFFGEVASSHPCPECGSDAFRIVYAPAVIGQASRAAHAAADKLLETELQNQKISTTSLKREPKRKAEAPSGPFAAHWSDAKELLPAGGRGVGGQLPFGMPRPITAVVGKYDGPA